MSRPNLKSDQRWFKQLFESSPDPAWIIDGNRFVACNEAAVRTLGYTSRGEFLNVHPSKLSPPTQSDGQDSFAKAEHMMAIAMDKGLHRFEWIHTRADGTNFVAEVTLSIVELESRPVIYCVWRDITERKRIEEKLQRQNHILSAVIDNFPGGISLFDAELRLAAHNDQFKQLLDLPDSLLGNPGVGFEDIARYNTGRGEYGPGDPKPLSGPQIRASSPQRNGAGDPWHAPARRRFRHHLHGYQRTQTCRLATTYCRHCL